MEKEFEERLQRKENETFQLSKELADLAIAMNMEAMKGRVMTTEFKKYYF